MSQTPAGKIRTFTGPEISDVVAEALSYMFETPGSVGAMSFVLVFGGDGPTPEDALRAALDDLREQCIDNRGRPEVLMSTSVMATESGSQIWGSVGCARAPSKKPPLPEINTITIEKESNEQWTMTIAVG